MQFFQTIRLPSLEFLMAQMFPAIVRFVFGTESSKICSQILTKKRPGDYQQFSFKIFHFGHKKEYNYTIPLGNELKTFSRQKRKKAKHHQILKEETSLT